MPRSLGFLVHDAARLFRRRFDQDTRHLDMTSAQLQILGRVTFHEGISQAQLACILDMEPITVSRHVDRMEAAGLVERMPDPQDRRVKLLSLTDKGRDLLPKMKKLAQSIFEDAQEGLSADEREILLDCLERIVTNLARKPADTDAPEIKQTKVTA
jgi:DNA-binding MarR family transcriptional regulator